jgi:uncharacterized protein with HEPN domain
MNGRDQSYLEDMLSFAEDAIELLGEADAPALAVDKRTRYAVIRAMEVVGEAAAKISEETRGRLAEAPWRQIVGMRNVLIHGYRGLDMTVVVETVRNHFPVLVAQLKRALGGASE